MSIYAGTNGYLDDIPVERRAPLRGRAARGLPHPLPRPPRRHHAPRRCCPTASATPWPSSRPGSSRARPPGRAVDPASVATPRASTTPRRPRRWRRSDGVAHGGWPGTHPAAPHQERPGDQEDHPRHGAHRRRPGSCGPSSASTPRVPYSEQITEVVRDLAAGRRARSRARSCSARPEIQQGLLRRDRRPTAACAAPTTPPSSAPPRARSSRTSATAATTRSWRVGRKAESYFRFRGYEIDAAFTGFTDNPTYEDAREVADWVIERFVAGELDRVRSSTPASSRSASRRSSPGRWLRWRASWWRTSATPSG